MDLAKVVEQIRGLRERLASKVADPASIGHIVSVLNVLGDLAAGMAERCAPCEEIEAEIDASGAVESNITQPESMAEEHRARLVKAKQERDDARAGREHFENLHDELAIEVRELQTKLKLTEANEKLLADEVATRRESDADQAREIHALKEINQAHRDREAQHIQEVEKAVALLVENYYAKVRSLLDVMMKHNRLGWLARHRRLPLQDAIHIVGWSPMEGGNWGESVKQVAKDVAAAVSTKQPPEGGEEAPSKRPTVHAV